MESPRAAEAELARDHFHAAAHATHVARDGDFAAQAGEFLGQCRPEFGEAPLEERGGEIVERLIDALMGADDGEVTVPSTKEFLRNYVATWGTTISRRLGYAIDDQFYGLTRPGFLQSVRGAIDKATPQQVNAAIEKHLQDENLYLVVITADAEAFKKKLLSGEPTGITYAGQRSADLLAQDKIIAALKLNVKESDVTVVPIDKIFE